MGAQSADSAVAEAVAIGKLWPNSKIILQCAQNAKRRLQPMRLAEIYSSRTMGGLIGGDPVGGRAA